jgi:hypothetical protein
MSWKDILKNYRDRKVRREYRDEGMEGDPTSARDFSMVTGLTKDDYCPNCGGELREYLDDPIDDVVLRCANAVKYKWLGKYQHCYSNGDE